MTSARRAMPAPCLKDKDDRRPTVDAVSHTCDKALITGI